MESLLLVSRAERLTLSLNRRRVLVLAYHNVVPTGEHPWGERSLHIPQEAFAAQLDALMVTHDVIPLSAIDDEPTGTRPRAVITFDDAYRGAVTAAVDELEKRSLPSTIFVAPGLFGQTTWWDRLAGVGTIALSPAVRNVALYVHGGRSETVIEAFGTDEAEVPSWAFIATEREVTALVGRPGIALAAHTWNHLNLATLKADELAQELERPLAWLRQFGKAASAWLAYPYGLSSSAVSEAAAAAGYLGAFRVSGSWLPEGSRSSKLRYDLPRMNVASSISLARFRLRTSGLLRA